MPANPLEILETQFTELLVDFVRKVNDKELAYGSSCEAVNQVEILLAAGSYLEREPARYELKASAENWSLDHLRDSVKEVFRHLNGDGLFTGWDIDGKEYSVPHHLGVSIICNALRELYPARLGQLQPEIGRHLSSAAVLAKLLGPYGRHEAPGYRGLNLILSDIAGLMEAGLYFNKREWIEIRVKYSE